MLSSEKTVLLQSFLGSLPKDIAARLATAVEIDRLAEGSALPHDLILEGLRPILRADDVRRRTPTPLRLFCRPFEDLLVNIPRREKQKGRILRGHVVPVWHWVSHVLVPAEAKAYAADIRSAAMTLQHGQALERSELFWPVAGKAMFEALKTNRRTVIAALGSEAAADDASDIALVLQSGSAMLARRRRWPMRLTPATPTLCACCWHTARRGCTRWIAATGRWIGSCGRMRAWRCTKG